MIPYPGYIDTADQTYLTSATLSYFPMPEMALYSLIMSLFNDKKTPSHNAAPPTSHHKTSTDHTASETVYSSIAAILGTLKTARDWFVTKAAAIDTKMQEIGTNVRKRLIADPGQQRTSLQQAYQNCITSISMMTQVMASITSLMFGLMQFTHSAMRKHQQPQQKSTVDKSSTWQQPAKETKDGIELRPMASMPGG